jgi:8-oxo-dGTP pyrophosphatase MutT (NUDIX family)
MNKHADQPIRPAATVIVAREADPQFEIFMLRRTSDAVFAGGMYVFPGGRVEEQDHSTTYTDHCQGPSKDQQHQFQALGDDARGYWIAGIRETFEEASILLAYHADGHIQEFDDASWQRFQAYRKALHDGTMSLKEICTKEDLTLALDLIHFYNRWITPPGRPRRFDTRFFITEAPAEQTGLHDGTETVDSIWISPNEALRLHAAGEFGLMVVTRMQLEDFARYTTADEFIAMAKDNREFPTYAPTRPPASS